MRLFIVLISMMSMPVVATAHHSRAEFSRETTELRGELIEVDWSNPHPSFVVRVHDQLESTFWKVQGYGSIYTLARAGVNGAHFVPGNSVRLSGNVSNRRENLLLVTNMLLADGREVVFRRDAAPIWTESAIGGEESFVPDETSVVDAAREDRGIFRLWSRPSQGSQTRYVPPLTEAAAAAAASWDELSDTSMACIPKGMPMAMGTPHPYEFVDQGDTILIRGHEFNIERTVHLDSAADPMEQSASHLGYSLGRWEGRTLIVETSRINWPLFSARGIPQSEDVRVVERYTLSDDQARLDYHMSVTDPATFTGTATVDGYWLALGEEPEPYDCKVDQ